MSSVTILPQQSLELRQHLPTRLTALSHRLSRRIAQFCARYRLSAAAWRIVAVLGQRETVHGNELIALAAMDKVRVSRAVAKLLRADLITRRADPRDRRYAILALTATGREVYRQIVPLVQDVEAELVAELSGDERALLDSALSKIEACLGQDGASTESANPAD